MTSSRSNAIAGLQWAVGIFSAVIGAGMLVSPHQFGSAAYSAFQTHLILWGTYFVLAGIALLANATLAPPRPVVILTHLCAGTGFLVLAGGFALVGGWTGVANYVVLGLGVMLAAMLSGGRGKQPTLRRIDLFASIVGLGSALTGLLIVFLPGQFRSPIYDVVRVLLPWYGGAFLVSGIGLVAIQFAHTRPRAAVWTAHVLMGATLLAFAGSSLPLRAWLGVAYYGGFGVTIATLPWLGTRLARVDPRSLQTRLAFVFSVVACVPLVAFASLSGHGLGGAGRAAAEASEAVQDLTFLVLILFGVAAVLAGMFIARWLTAPLTALTSAVSRLSAGDVSPPLPIGGVSEIAKLSGAFGDMRSTLAARTIEREQAEADLREREAHYRQMYRGIPIPTSTWRRQGNDFVLEDCNDAAAAASSDHHIGDLIGALASVHYADRPEFIRALQGCVDEQRTIKCEITEVPARGGRGRVLAATCVWLPPDTLMLHTEDVSEVKHAERHREALAHSEKMRALGQMATGVAHDLNQSLMLISSYSDLARQALERDPLDVEDLRDLMTTATQAALDGGESVRRLLVFTRPPRTHAHQPVDLAAVVHQAAQLTTPRWRDAALAEGCSIHLGVEASGHPTTLGSPGQLREALTNLIFNAVDALPNGGTITLRVATAEGRASVEVHDSGVGMTPEQQAHIFEPFFTTKGDSGSGLGLSMVYGIVEQHGGQIDVESRLGSGTTVRLSFTTIEPVPSIAELSPGVVPSPPAHLRLLAVDDEPSMTRAIVRMLRPAGHHVTVAASGEEALERLAAEAFDIVVSDLGMGGGMNGWDLAATVKRRWPEASVCAGYRLGAQASIQLMRARKVSRQCWPSRIFSRTFFTCWRHR